MARKKGFFEKEAWINLVLNLWPLILLRVIILLVFFQR